MKKRFIIEFDSNSNPYWITCENPQNGDPARTLIKSSAKLYASEKAAQRALSRVLANNKHRYKKGYNAKIVAVGGELLQETTFRNVAKPNDLQAKVYSYQSHLVAAHSLPLGAIMPNRCTDNSRLSYVNGLGKSTFLEMLIMSGANSKTKEYGNYVLESNEITSIELFGREIPKHTNFEYITELKPNELYEKDNLGVYKVRHFYYKMVYAGGITAFILVKGNEFAVVIDNFNEIAIIDFQPTYYSMNSCTLIDLALQKDDSNAFTLISLMCNQFYGFTRSAYSSNGQNLNAMLDSFKFKFRKIEEHRVKVLKNSGITLLNSK